MAATQAGWLAMAAGTTQATASNAPAITVDVFFILGPLLCPRRTVPCADRLVKSARSKAGADQTGVRVLTDMAFRHIVNILKYFRSIGN
jgi:hypothetical protein